MNVFMHGFRGVSNTDKITVMSNGMDLNVKFENNEIVITEREKPKEEFITVIDGWRGSLKLKECWVKDSFGESWYRRGDFELLARDDLSTNPFKVLNNHNVLGYKHLKFRPFSPENPAPVDWPAMIRGSVSHCANNSHKTENQYSFYDNGRTSFSGGYGRIIADTDEFKFLNIEPVEE